MGRGTVPLPFLHAPSTFYLFVPRRPYTSRRHICIQGRKTERRKLGASTTCFHPAGKKMLFSTNLSQTKADFLGRMDGKRITRPPLAGRKAEERKNLTLCFLHGKDRNGFMRLFHSLNVTWSLDSERDGEMQVQEGKEQISRWWGWARSGSQFVWRTGGHTDWRASWGLYYGRI